MNVDEFLDDVPDELRGRNGAVFYSGRSAFLNYSEYYLLGLNPGEDDATRFAGSVSESIASTSNGPNTESAYVDEKWGNCERGQHTVQRRVQYLCRRIGVTPDLLPASNAIFVRTNREADLGDEKSSLLKLCWPVHRRVIDELRVRIVICLGGTVSAFVRSELGATELLASFTETYPRRKWASTLWASNARADRERIYVAHLSHPSRANWLDVRADPTELVLHAAHLAGAS